MSILSNLKALFSFARPIRDSYRRICDRYWAKRSPRHNCERRFKRAFGRKINWENPQTYNEKVNWMKFYGDTSQWPILADKYKVREYVKQRGLEHILVPLYGVWENADDINFDKLPSSFILKTNNGSATNIVVPDKSKIDITAVRIKLNEWLKQCIGLSTAELHYLEIPPRIISEKLLPNDCENSTSLLDYKFYCLNGEPHMIQVCANRHGQHADFIWYTLDWKRRNDVFKSSTHDCKTEFPRPACLKEMIEYARILAKGNPVVRVDFYVIEDKPLFGEMTMTPCGGYYNNFFPAADLEFGRLITLPPKPDLI